MDTSVADLPIRTKDRPSTTKRMIIMVVGVLVLIALIAAVKVAMIMRIIAASKQLPPPAVVTAARTAYQQWQPQLRAVGTLRAARGADLSLDIAGLVTHVNVKSGDDAAAGQLLLQLRDTEDVASLQQLQAQAALAEVTFERAKQQLAVQVIAKADYDQAAADLKVKQAAVAQQVVNVSKKQLRAPFSGHAGIVTVNPGVYLNAGTVVVTLQQLDPVYADFYLPQKDLTDLRTGQRADLTLDAFRGKSFTGTVNAISPKVDADTRNVLVEATVPNRDRLLTPGMFANVHVNVGSPQRYLTLPQTAIVYNPYGQTVYVVKTKPEFDADQAAAAAENPKAMAQQPKAAKPPARGGPQLPPDTLVAEQVFVTTGATRGDQVAILSGLEEGVQVVTSGQIKLKNGAPLKIDNSVQPADDARPTPQEH